jgi:hypothetical protein
MHVVSWQGSHGKGGVSQTENIPSPGVQPDLFVHWQLIFFRSGARKNEVPQPIVEQLRNEGIEIWALTALRCRRPRRQSLMKRRRSETGAKIAVGRGCAKMNFRKRVMHRRHGNRAYLEYSEKLRTKTCQSRMLERKVE